MDHSDIKERIIKEIEKTERLVREYQELTRPVSPDNAIGRVSRMDAINNKSVAESALREAEEKVNKLKYALTKVDSADFGICIKCKKTIPPGRLLIRPESPYCVNCA